MASSQNGWVANERDRVASQLVPGTTVKLTVRRDAPGHLLLEVAAAFDRLVEDIDNGRAGLDDWGYAERPIRGGSQLSNHASGTAIDLNAPRHPLGKSGTFSPSQTATIRKIIAVTGGVVRWGGDYSGRKDEMHFEINDNRDMDDCDRALAAMRTFNRSAGPKPAPPAERNEMQHDFLVPDYYTANSNDRMWVSEAIAWGTRHAAKALDAANASNAALARVEKQLADLAARLDQMENK